MDIQERLTAFAMLGATWVMWLLVALSIVGLAVALERAYFLFSASDDFAKLKADLLKLMRDKDLEGALKRARASKALEARIVAAGLESADRGPASVEESMTGESMMTKLVMERNLVFLGTVGNNAPFVGLLGTVIGVIRSFAQLNTSGGQVSEGLMADVGESLVATAIGILVAIPSVAAFNYFNRVVKTRITRADALGRDVMSFLKAEAPASSAKEK